MAVADCQANLAEPEIESENLSDSSSLLQA
jgi:hypothetical protein